MVVDSEKLIDRWMDAQTKDKQEAIRKAPLRFQLR